MDPRIRRASAAGIWAKCPGSVNLVKIEKPDTPESLEGDLCHALAFQLGEGFNAEDSPEWNGTGLPITPEIREGAVGFVQFCNNLANSDDVKVYVLREVFLGQAEGLPSGVQGTADFVAFDARMNTLHVADLKFGFGTVEAFENWQLLVYALGAAGLFGLVNPPTVKLHIYQPRDYSGGPVKTWTIEPTGWDYFASEVHRRAGETFTSSECRTGDQCRYCESRTSCAAFWNTTSHALESVSSAPLSEDWKGKTLGAELEYLNRAFAVIKSAKEAMEDLAVHRITSGTPIAGWVMERKQGNRKWSASIEDIKAVGEMAGVNLLEEKPISVTLATQNKKIAPLIESLMSRSAGTPKLARFNSAKTKELFKK